MKKMNAEALYDGFLGLAPGERAKFFSLLASPSVFMENFSHEQVFGHLAGDSFTASEAAEYLEVSMSTFRRYVSDGRILASSVLGRNQLYATKDLKKFKRSLHEVRARSSARST